MLRKQILTLKQATQAQKNLPLIITIDQQQQLPDALSVLQHYPHSLKGLCLPQHLLESNLLPPHITYIRIHVEKLITIENILSSLALKKRFIEVFIPIELLPNPLEMQHCQLAHRMVIEIHEQSDLTAYPQLYSQFLLLSRYPLFVGAPLCSIPPEHCYEFFDQPNTIIPAKPLVCNNCLFIKHCPFDETLNGKKFSPKPITDIEKYNDALTFIKAQTTHHENTPPRL